jgi:hypothetical protein
MYTGVAMDLPIVCTLSAAELQERKMTILALLRDAMLSRTRIADGYRYEFANKALRDVSRVAELESQCCQFLNFNVIEGEKSVWLDVTGKPEALKIVEDLFG